MEKLIEDLKERIEIGLQYDTISGGTANDLLELVTKMQVKNNGVLAVVINCPLCGGEMAFVHPENCMTEGCPNCVF